MLAWVAFNPVADQASTELGAPYQARVALNALIQGDAPLDVCEAPLSSNDLGGHLLKMCLKPFMMMATSRMREHVR